MQAATALLLLSPFVPMLFQGQEWSATAPFPYFADHTDPALVDAVRRGRREEFAAFGWRADELLDPEDPLTFDAAKLRWEECGEDDHARVLSWVRTLLEIRRRLRGRIDDGLALTGAATRPSVAVDEDRGTLLLERGPLFVAVNVGDTPAAFASGDAVTVLLSSQPVSDDQHDLELEPGTTTVGLLHRDRDDLDHEGRGHGR
jgi:maltooligosyltrehalose trehalohydrolase